MAGGPRLSKAKAGQAKTSAPVGPMTGQRGFAQRNATEREQAPGCERGATFEQSENGGASTLPPVGATTGCAGFCAAKTELKTRRAGVLPLGARRGAAVTGTAK